MEESLTPDKLEHKVILDKLFPELEPSDTRQMFTVELPKDQMYMAAGDDEAIRRFGRYVIEGLIE